MYEADPSLSVLQCSQRYFFIIVYLDNIFLAGTNDDIMDLIVNHLNAKFKVHVLDFAKLLIEMIIEGSCIEIKLRNSSFITRPLKVCGMD